MAQVDVRMLSKIDHPFMQVQLVLLIVGALFELIVFFDLVEIQG